MESVKIPEKAFLPDNNDTGDNSSPVPFVPVALFTAKSRGIVVTGDKFITGVMESVKIPFVPV
jgi:hypothetical protein